MCLLFCRMLFKKAIYSIILQNSFQKGNCAFYFAECLSIRQLCPVIQDQIQIQIKPFKGLKTSVQLLVQCCLFVHSPFPLAFLKRTERNVSSTTKNLSTCLHMKNVTLEQTKNNLENKSSFIILRGVVLAFYSYEIGFK